ncbi:hypothetical protein FRB96_004579 [Tulasnella sp. 330]|nr:hypothetical protein FRB96_004579 [Tulasnella sp. 330]KAG8890865.1 hypothetical protein FRB98_004910 [Tulasnella sp. 332]
MASYSASATLPSCLLEPFPPPLGAPVAFEGTDLSLATEVLPPPPPLFSSNGKRPGDYTRKRAIPSFLPSTDPASTYNSGTGVKGAEYTATDDEGSDRGGKRKRQRTEKAEASLPKQATSRHQSPRGPVQPELPIDVSKLDASADVEVDRISSASIPPEPTGDVPLPAIPPHVSSLRARRSSSLLAASRLSQLDWSISGNGKRNDADVASPTSFVDGQMSAEVRDGSQSSKEGSKGKGKDKVDEQITTSRAAGPFAELINKTATDFPSVFLLPEDVRGYFRDIGTTTEGTYVDTSDLRGAKSSRPGVLEERDPYRLRDRQGLITLCFKCGTSAASYETEDDPLQVAAQTARNGRDSVPTAAPPATRVRANSSIKYHSDRGASPERSNRSGHSGQPSEPDEEQTVLMHPGPWRSPSIQIKEEPLPSQLGPPQPPPMLRRSSRRSAAAPDSTPVTTKAEVAAEPPPVTRAVEASDFGQPVGLGIKLPVGVTTSGLKAMIACDYCPLSWHLDCLDPPMVTLPPNHRKWMCPNHADHVIPKRRTPRHIKTVTVTSTTPVATIRKTYGNIEVIPIPIAPRPSIPSIAPKPEGLPLAPRVERATPDTHAKKRKRTSLDSASHGVEDFTINGVKYRLPEKMIRLNFWNFRQSTGKTLSVAPRALKDRATIIRERARRTLSSTSSLSSLSESSDPGSDSEEKSRTATASEHPQLSDPNSQLAAEALVSMNASRPVPSNTGLESVLPQRHTISEPLEELITTALPTKIPPSPSGPKVVIAASKKPVSSSYKIRIPALAARHAPAAFPVTNSMIKSASKTAIVISADRQQKLSSEISVSSGSTGSHLLPNSTSELDDISKRQQNGTVPTNVQGPTSSTMLGVTSEELEQLRAIRELMAVKGKQALLDFLKS